MSKTDRNGKQHPTPDEICRIRDPHQRRLAFFRKHGVWINEDVEPEDGNEEATEISREHALADGWSNELIERMYGPWVDKSKAALARKK
jgi:hypothetical protein